MIIVEMERSHPTWHNFHTYLHFIEAIDQYKQELASDWQGVARRVQQMLDVQRLKQSEELDDKIEGLHKALHKTIEAQDNKLVAVLKETEVLSTRVGELLSNM
eukprot:SAG22_NODE_1346_length_4674_cov_2.003934_5_plen_103_part_00